MTYGEPAKASHGARLRASNPTDATATEPQERGTNREDGPESVLPRLLAFYRDSWDGDGVATGWHTVAWGLALPDGTAISVPVTGPTAVTVWTSLEDALFTLDAYVDDVVPRRRGVDMRDARAER